MEFYENLFVLFLYPNLRKNSDDVKYRLNIAFISRLLHDRAKYLYFARLIN